MKKNKFELDLNYGQGYPIGMNPEKKDNYDNNEDYFQYLENWKPHVMPPAAKKIRTNPSKICVVLS